MPHVLSHTGRANSNGGFTPYKIGLAARPQFCMGFLTLELMIALILITLSVTAVILVSFGSQGMLVGAQTSSEALQKAQGMLEGAQQLARTDFDMVNPIATTTDGIYQVSLSVAPYAANEYFVKKVTAHVAWTDERHTARTTSLTLLVTDYTHAVGGNTCSSALNGKWNPPILTPYPLNPATFGSLPASGYQVSDMNAYQGMLYVAMGSTTNATDPTLLIFDIKNPATPLFKGALDNAASTKDGFAAVAIATSSTSNYAYLANIHDASWNSCAQGPACAQLQIVNIANPAAPSLTANIKLATNTVPFVNGSGGQAVGKSIFFKDNYVYLGLSKTGTGPELVIIDVHNFPSSPPVVLGSFSVGAAVNAIDVKGDYAYLATASTTARLIVLYVKDPLHPVRVYTPIGNGFGNGKALATAGGMLYFGRTFDNSNPELAVFNNKNPSSTAPSLATTTELGVSLDGIIVRDYLRFLLTNTDLQIVNATSSAHTTLALPAVGGTYPPSFDCEGNTLYVGSSDGSGNGVLSVITPTP